MSSLGSNRGGWMGAAMCTAIVVLLGFGCHFNGTQYDELTGSKVVSFPSENRVGILKEGGEARLLYQGDGVLYFSDADGGRVQCARSSAAFVRPGSGGDPPDDDRRPLRGPRGLPSSDETLFRACEARANGFIDNATLADVLLEVARRPESSPGDTFLRVALRGCERAAGETGGEARSRGLQTCYQTALDIWERRFAAADAGASAASEGTLADSGTSEAGRPVKKK